MNDNDLLKKEELIIKKSLLEFCENYKKTISYMYADVPIGVLCLSKTIETILLRNGIVRVYDLIDRDLTKIKGIGHRRVRDLTASLDKFLSVGF